MTVHPIYRVRSFQFLAPYTLRVQFDDQTEQVINFERSWPASFTARFGTQPCSIECKSIPRCIRWYGRMARILIRQRSTIGQNTPRLMRRAHASGNRRLPEVGSPRRDAKYCSAEIREKSWRGRG